MEALKHWTKSTHDAVLEVRKNPIDKKALLSVTKKFRLSNMQAAQLGKVSLRTFQRKKSSSKLSVDASESFLILSELYKVGMMAFDGNEESFLTWLNTPIPAMKNQKPKELITTALGASLVKDELLRIEYGIY